MKNLSRILGKYPILSSILLVIVNLLLTVFLISILADGILRYKVGFWIVTPLILLLLLLFFQLLFGYIHSISLINWKGFLTLALFEIINLINLIFLIFNIFCWADLFDGKTEALLP